MAIKIEVHCNSSFNSPHSLEKTLALLSNYEQNIGNHFEGLQNFIPEGKDVYRWVFKTLSYGGNQLKIEFKTQFQQVGTDMIKIIPVDSTCKAALSGCWKLLPLNEGTRVNFEADLVGELPLPSLMKSMVTPIAQREVTKIFDQYIHNVSKSL
ncbi:MAG: hypothetical protein ACKOA8_16565 [Deltaproteobacteria bacterium]